MEEELKKVLLEKRWTYKFETYNKYYEYIDINNTVFNPHISVIIISWRLHENTITTLKKIIQQKENNNIEIIFVDNGSKATEFSEIKSFVDKYIRLNQNTGVSISRNIGAAFSKAPVLLFLEDDGIPDEDLVASHICTHLIFEPYSVRGVCLPLTNNLLNNKQVHYYRGNQYFPLYANLEGNTSYNAKVFFEVGGWDDDIKYGGEGKALAIKIWEYSPDFKKQIYSPISIIYHDYASSHERLKEKLDQQKRSFDYLSHKYSIWNKFDELWLNYEGNVASLNETDLWKNDSKQRKYHELKARVYKRNEANLLSYMNGKVFLHDSKELKMKIRKCQGKCCISIFGAGEYGLKVYSNLLKYGIHVNYFIDNDSSKWGNKSEGIPIIGPSSLTKEHFILIASSWFFEISEELQRLGYRRNEDYLIVI